jgi:23S rRNA pseudouridine1911/1915/1917 synthase
LAARTADPERAGVGVTFEAAAADRGRRLDVAVAARCPDYSRSRAALLAARGEVLVDRVPRKAAFRLRPGQRVDVLGPPADAVSLRPEAIDVPVVYEDAEIVVVDKPAGLTVHPAPGHLHGTLVNALLARLPALAAAAGSLRPGIVHRLDKDTSGLLVVARTDAAYRALTAQVRARTVARVYLALVRGDLGGPELVIRAPVGRHPTRRTRMAVVAGGRPAVTRVAPRERFGDATLVECRLETGRTHQIRVHLAHAGHPILGDPVYGVPAAGIARQALHAWRLALTHPQSGAPLVFTAPPPQDFQALLARLRAGQPADPARRRARPESVSGSARSGRARRTKREV